MKGIFFVKFTLCNKSDCFKWALPVVYGPAQMDKKERFLAELVSLGSHESLPLVRGGDFNILRKPSEKNNDNFDHCCPFPFNVVIDGLCLKELEMVGRQYTWANNLTPQTFEKLDRVLVTTNWDHKYPLSSVVGS